MSHIIEDSPLVNEIMDAMDTCPMNPTHIIMTREKFHEVKDLAPGSLFILFPINKPPTVMGLAIIICDHVDRMYCGRLKE